jgi:hypothetical protein
MNEVPKPSANPMAVSTIPFLTNSQTMLPGWAPSDKRMPISLVRSEARLAMTPLGKLETAEYILRLNAEAYPKSVRCLMNLAEIDGMRGKREEEIESLEAALKIDPHNQECIQKIGQVR